VLFAALQAAGDLLDLFGGFTLAMAYDPLSQNQSSVFGRFYNLVAGHHPFATDGHW
jgi:flagellar biosynthetic protein FliR